MKRLLFGVVMLFCMGMTMNAQGLKTYSGAYRANAHFLLGTQKATYTYKNAEDGTRIYEGNFTYSCITNPTLYLKVTGRFHDDCKEGLWTYIDKSSETKTLKINFKEGYRNGIYEYAYTTKNGRIKESLKATMKYGVIVGAVSGRTNYYHYQIYDYGIASERSVMGQGVFNGQTDEDGLADGLWKLTMRFDDNSTRVFYDKWKHGVVTESYYIDDTTGDKVECAKNWGIPSVIFDVVKTPYHMERLIDRGSDKPWQGQLLGKDEVDEIKTKIMNSDEVYQKPKTDYGGYSNDEEFIQAKSTIPNILYKLNGTNVDCVIDEHGNVVDIEFVQAPKDAAAAKELERCLKLLKYKPAIYKGLSVKCKWGFWYDDNKSLSKDDAKNTESQGSLKEISREDLIKEMESTQLPKENTQLLEEKTKDERIFDTVEEMPSYSGGQGALMSFLANNIQYPIEAQKKGVQGRVIVEFIIEKDGTITNVKVLHGVDPALDKEAIRVIKSMPKWNPGKQNGSAVRVRYEVPIVFGLK